MDKNKCRVLVVEDVIVAQKVAMITLNTLGCEVDIANTGAQAIEFGNKRVYDIILMDLGLPDMDGLTVTEAIRQMEGQSKRPIIIALTAHSGNEDDIDNKKNCLNVGMDDYIQKPLTKELTIKILEKFFPNNQPIKEPPS